jgi:di/tripeptidase
VGNSQGSGGGSALDETSKETCGDPPDVSATWYAVFIDGGNLNEIHRRFCKDAIAVNRQDSGKASIQVASFTDRARAEAFAKSVNGEVSRYEPNSPKKVAEAETTEHMLATLDGGVFSESTYSTALDQLRSRCTEDREKLANMAYGAAKEARS